MGEVFFLCVQALYYSISQQELCRAVLECPKLANVVVAFQNEFGVSVSGFLWLLRLHLEAVFVMRGVRTVVPRSGLCIGSCVASVPSGIVLSDII